MLAEYIFTLGLGRTPPWRVMSRPLDTKHTPAKFHLEIGANSKALYPRPECGVWCKAHLKEYTWPHLNSLTIIANLRPDSRGSTARNTESVAWEHHGPGKTATSLYFSSRWS